MRFQPTHLDKIFWPKEGYTKGDVLSYYTDVADLILPHLKNRPENLNRHPNGIEGSSFYQKNFEHQPPDFIKTQKIFSESTQEDINYLFCQNLDSLLYMANLGCIEINPWHSRLPHLDRPDFCLIDLDAKTTDFGEVVKVAQAAHKLLDKLSVESFVKTSGKSGMHIVIPMGAKYSYEQSKQFAQLLVTGLHQNLANTSLERNPEKRQGQIYLDFLQNSQGQTMAAAYCLRPVAGACVSTPLEWGEVRAGLDPKKFNIKTAPKRFQQKGDLWQRLLDHPGIDMKSVLTQLESQLN